MPKPICFLALLSGWEVVALLALILIYFGSQTPGGFWFWRGMRRGLSEFKKSQDEIGHEAGRAIGGIFGKPVAEAIKPRNEVAEFYDGYQGDAGHRPDRKKNWFRQLLRWVSKLLSRP